MRVFIYMFIYIYPCTHTHTDNHICMYMMPHAFLLDQIVGGGGRSTHLLLMGPRYNWLVTNCSCKCSVLLHQTHACCSSWQPLGISQSEQGEGREDFFSDSFRSFFGMVYYTMYAQGWRITYRSRWADWLLQCFLLAAERPVAAAPPLFCGFVFLLEHLHYLQCCLPIGFAFKFLRNNWKSNSRKTAKELLTKKLRSIFEQWQNEKKEFSDKCFQNIRPGDL